MENTTKNTSQISSVEASFSRPVNPGFGKADRKDHSYGDSYDHSMAVDPAEASSRITEDVLLAYLHETLLRHHDLDASQVNIELKNGEVILSGSVPQYPMIAIAADAVSRVQGVSGVTNRISLASDLSQ